MNFAKLFHSLVALKFWVLFGGERHKSLAHKDFSVRHALKLNIHLSTGALAKLALIAAGEGKVKRRGRNARGAIQRGRFRAVARGLGPSKEPNCDRRKKPDANPPRGRDFALHRSPANKRPRFAPLSLRPQA